MADVKISELTDASYAQADDELTLVQSGTTKAIKAGSLQADQEQDVLTDADSPYSILSTATVSNYFIGATGGNVTINLPAGADMIASGRCRLLRFIRTDGTANTVTIDADGTDTIDGSGTKTLASGDATTLIGLANGLWYSVND